MRYIIFFAISILAVIGSITLGLKIKDIMNSCKEIKPGIGRPIK